jgi:hypothetical protein
VQRVWVMMKLHKAERKAALQIAFGTWTLEESQ